MAKPDQTDDRKASARRFRFLTLEEFDALDEQARREYARAARAVTLEWEKNALPPPKIWE